jgi:hypothetical protein
VLATLERAAATGAAGDRACLRAVHDRAVEETSWSDINAQHLDRLRAALGAGSLVELPYLFSEEFGETEIAALAQDLEAATTAGRS